MFLGKWFKQLIEFDQAYSNSRIQSELAKKDQAKFYWCIAHREIPVNAYLLAAAKLYIQKQELLNPNWKQWCQEWQQSAREFS